MYTAFSYDGSDSPATMVWNDAHDVPEQAIVLVFSHPGNL